MFSNVTWRARINANSTTNETNAYSKMIMLSSPHFFSYTRTHYIKLMKNYYFNAVTNSDTATFEGITREIKIKAVDKTHQPEKKSAWQSY